MIMEIGFTAAMNLFSSKDFKDYSKFDSMYDANSVTYYIDLDLEKVFVRFYKDGVYVDTHYFSSTKLKMKNALKIYRGE